MHTEDADFSARVLLRLCAANPPNRLLPPGETKQQVQSGTGESHHAVAFAFFSFETCMLIFSLWVCVSVYIHSDAYMYCMQELC